MSIVVLLLVCLHHVTSLTSISAKNVSNTKLTKNYKKDILAVGANITDNKIDYRTKREIHILDKINVTGTKTDLQSKIYNSEEINSHEAELENTTVIYINPYTDKDGLIDVVADNGIKYESSASDNFVLPGHDDDDGNFAGITDDSEPMHYYVSEEGDLSLESDAVGIEEKLPDYVKPTRKRDDDEMEESGETTTIDEDLIIPDSVETTTTPTTEPTTWFYHSREFRGENFESKEEDMTTPATVDQEYIDEDEQNFGIRYNTNVTENPLKEAFPKPRKQRHQTADENKFELEGVNGVSDDLSDYNNLMVDDSSSLEQTTTVTAMINKKDEERYVITFSKDFDDLNSSMSSNESISTEDNYSKSSSSVGSSDHASVSLESIPYANNTSEEFRQKERKQCYSSENGSTNISSSNKEQNVTERIDSLQTVQNQTVSKRTKRENEQSELKFQKEGNEGDDKGVTESTIIPTTKLWRWPTHSWENHGDMYQSSSEERVTRVSRKLSNRSGEEMEYSEEDISVGIHLMDTETNDSGRASSSENKVDEQHITLITDVHKGNKTTSYNDKIQYSPATEESQYDDVTPTNRHSVEFPYFNKELVFNQKNSPVHFFTRNIGSQELFFPPICLIEWEKCELDDDCCKPLFCSVLPRFPVIDDINETSALEIGQFCSRFQSNILGNINSNNRTDLLQTIESYKRKMLEVINS